MGKATIGLVALAGLALLVKSPVLFAVAGAGLMVAGCWLLSDLTGL